MNTVSLAHLAPGQDATVMTVENSEMAQRMLMLGIRRGTTLQIVHGPGARGAVVRVGGARLALGREVLAAIQVQTENTE